MNITAIGSVIVATSTGFIVMCKILTVVITVFLNECTFCFPWPQFTNIHLDIYYMCIYVYYYIYTQE